MSSLCWLICQHSRLFVVIRLDILLLVSALTKIDPNYTPLVISPITIEAIDKDKNNPGYIWLCVGGWAWKNFENSKGGSGLDMINAWGALTESLQSNQ